MLAAVMLGGAGLAEPAGAGTVNTAMDAGKETGQPVFRIDGVEQLTETDIQILNRGTAKIHTRGGRAVFVEGTCAKGPVRDMDDAGKVVRSMIRLMGGEQGTELEPWREITDPAGNRYYIFQQMEGDTTVLGGAVKVITDAEDRMLGLTASLITGLPDSAAAEGITAEAAEELTLKHRKVKAGTELVPGKTQRIILPVALELDVEAETMDENSRFVWAVYTTNPDNQTEMPYLAHYVTMQGEYLYSMPAILPGDKASQTGYPAEYAFKFMEPVDYTGDVDLSDGTEKEIAVTLMRDTRTGTYYLGNIERRIAVADCWEFLYNEGRVDMLSSEDNREWEQKALLSLYNYCRAYDYYRDIGWIGADGLGTPILILNNFCDREHRPVDNAAFAGQYYGWQIFLSSRANDLAQCLDVLAHEFTHCVTQTTMTYNDYMNDRGAINEAISDIQGNICEMMSGATEDETWKIGENAKETVRSMSDPHRYGQPEHTWDLYYDDHVTTPTAVNDQGGVHTNSSLLNRVAWMLCEKGGMSLQEARAFWFAADCAMTPGTDYSQLTVILPFVLEHMGMSAYAASLEEAMAATRLGQTDAPETAKADQTILTLKLPDSEIFTDGNWSMWVATLNLDGLRNRMAEVALKIALGDTEDLPKVVTNLAGIGLKIAGQGSDLSPEEFLGDLLSEGNLQDLIVTEEDREDLYRWLGSLIRETFYSDMGAAGEDGRTIRMVSTPGYTIPYLTYITFEDNSSHVKQMNAALWIHNRWVDMSGLIAFMMGESKKGFLTSLAESGLIEALGDAIIAAKSPQDFLKKMIIKTTGGDRFEIPASGLDNLTLEENIASMMNTTEETEDDTVAMSRPKG